MADFFKDIIKKNKKKFIFVAEISANHGGNIENAKKLIQLSKQNGSDFVKFQTYENSSMTINSNNQNFLIKKGIWKNSNLWSLYGKAQTPYSWQKKLFNFALNEKIQAFSSPFDEEGVDILNKLNCKIFKIASLETNDYPLIDKIVKTKKPIIFSTGTSDLKEISKTYRYIKSKGVKDVAILYCVSNYPSEYKDFNFNNITLLKKKFNCVVGFSDHSNDPDIAKCAISAGAEIIEKHVMISKKIKSPDQKFSLEAKKISIFISELEKVKRMFENKKKYFISKKEIKNRKFRRSVYVIKPIEKGELINENNIKCLRPKVGISPEKFNSLLNLKCPATLNYGKPITIHLYKKIIEYNNKK